ncbi:hypothetical protein DPMN_053868 [Dreissena polymorpha]|uniref:Uncharacterized protein n=2 Tax=Dreissena polymorpha TaxID=45954 RepID=A0A9D4CMY3_DREPO|nr:hypothetical protein DPMN_053868 [Dreissena polymorpha]
MGYEVPKFVCGPSDDNTELLACPTPDSLGRIHCIDFYSLCDHKIHCPNGEDEDSTMCLFHTATHQYMDKMMTMISRMNRETQETLQTVLAKVQPREPSYLNYNIQK